MLAGMAQGIALAWEMGVETIRCVLFAGATPAMPDDTPLAIPYPSLARKKITAAFDGGCLSSDSSVLLLLLLSQAERRRAIVKTLAALINDPRDPAHVTHTVEDVLRARIFAIACGYPDGNDFN